jgi:hypothetical protein
MNRGGKDPENRLGFGVVFFWLGFCWVLGEFLGSQENRIIIGWIVWKNSHCGL